MKSEKIIKNKLYQILDYLMRIILLNFIGFIVALFLPFIYLTILENEAFEGYPNYLTYFALIPLIFTLFPTILSIFNVMKQYEDGDSGSVIKDFFHSFKKYYKQSLIISLVIIVLSTLLTNSIYVFWQLISNDIANKVGFVLTLSLIVIILFMFLHLPLTMVNIDGLRIKEYLKLSIIFAFKDFLLTFLVLVIVVVAIFAMALWPVLMVFLGISLPIFLITKMTYKIYNPISKKYENNEEENEK